MCAFFTHLFGEKSNSGIFSWKISCVVPCVGLPDKMMAWIPAYAGMFRP